MLLAEASMDGAGGDVADEVLVGQRFQRYAGHPASRHRDQVANGRQAVASAECRFEGFEPLLIQAARQPPPVAFAVGQGIAEATGQAVIGVGPGLFVAAAG
jgi:hypothetical protein